MKKTDEKVLNDVQESLKILVQNMIFDGHAEIKREAQNGKIVFNIIVPNEQVGRIIGKDGTIIKAIRKVYEMIGCTNSMRIEVNVPVDEE